jgi:hypothetical protein
LPGDEVRHRGRVDHGSVFSFVGSIVHWCWELALAQRGHEDGDQLCDQAAEIEAATGGGSSTAAVSATVG